MSKGEGKILMILFLLLTVVVGMPLDSDADFESYPVPAASAYVVPDVGTTTPSITDADNTSEGAGVSALVASAHATAWKRNGSARALGFAHTGAGGDGWVFVELSALSDLPAELIEQGGKVVVTVTGAAQSTLADSYTPNVWGRWELQIGTPGQTQVWSDGTGSNFGGATISGTMLLIVGGTAFSRNNPVASGEQNECLDFNPTDKGCWEFAALPPAPLGSGAASLTRSVTIRMPVGQKFLVWWRAESLNDAMAVIDPVLTVHPDHAQYVALEIDGIEPPTPAPGPLDGVDIGALAARGYNIEQLGSLDLLGPYIPVYVAQTGNCGGKTPCYDVLQTAINSSESLSVINLTQETYAESIVFSSPSSPKFFTLRGGWDSGFTSCTSDTEIQGSMTISDGKVIVENIILW